MGVRAVIGRMINSWPSSRVSDYSELKRQKLRKNPEDCNIPGRHSE